MHLCPFMIWLWFCNGSCAVLSSPSLIQILTHIFQICTQIRGGPFPLLKFLLNLNLLILISKERKTNGFLLLKIRISGFAVLLKWYKLYIRTYICTMGDPFRVLLKFLLASRETHFFHLNFCSTKTFKFWFPR